MPCGLAYLAEKCFGEQWGNRKMFRGTFEQKLISLGPGCMIFLALRGHFMMDNAAANRPCAAERSKRYLTIKPVSPALFVKAFLVGKGIQQNLSGSAVTPS